MGAITTSIVIQFEDPSGGDTGAHLSAEVDGRSDGYNQGDTAFVAGDNPVFLLYKTPDVTVETIETSSGSTMKIGSGTVAMEEILTFTKDKRTSLSRPSVGFATLTVLAGAAPGLQQIGVSLVTTEDAIAVVKAVYNAPFEAYRLSNVPDNLGGETTFPVVIVISGVAA